MKSSALVAAIMFLAACSAPEERERKALMDQIERAAKLPSGAPSLRDYARFYSYEGKDQVIGVYALPSVVERLASEECSEMTGIDTPWRDVPCVLPKVAKTHAGMRLWVDKSSDLPFDVVAGCEVITLAYDLPTQRFQELGCVGHRPMRH